MSSEKPIISGPGASNETWETTAQWASAEASTRELADEVEKNARREAEAAKQAADAARVRPPTTSPLHYMLHPHVRLAYLTSRYHFLRFLDLAFYPRYDR